MIYSLKGISRETVYGPTYSMWTLIENVFRIFCTDVCHPPGPKETSPESKVLVIFLTENFIGIFSESKVPVTVLVHLWYGLSINPRTHQLVVFKWGG